MSSTDASKMKKTRATSGQSSKPTKSYPPTSPTKPSAVQTPTADQVRLQQLLISDSELQGYANSAEMKGKVHKVMDVTGMNEEDVLDALERCNFDEEQAITLLVEGGPTSGQWKTTGKKKKGKGEKQTDRDIDAIDAPGYSRANGVDKELEKKDGTNRAANKSTRENYGGYVTVTEKGQTDRGTGGRGFNGRQNRGGFNNRGGRGRPFGKGRGGRGGTSFGGNSRDRPGQTGGFGRTPKTETANGTSWGTNHSTTEEDNWNSDCDASSPDGVKNNSVSPVLSVGNEPTLSYENANGSEDVFASISSSSVERTLPYSNTVTVPLTLSSSTNLAGLHEDPAIVTVVSSSSRQQVRIRRVIKKGPSQIPTAPVEMPVSKYRTDISDEFSDLGINFGSSPTTDPPIELVSVESTSLVTNLPVDDSHVTRTQTVMANQMDSEVEVPSSANESKSKSSVSVVGDIGEAVSQFGSSGPTRTLGGLVGSPDAMTIEELQPLQSSNGDSREVAEHISISGTPSSLPAVDAVTLGLSTELTSVPSHLSAEPSLAAKPSQLVVASVPGHISLPSATTTLASGDSQSIISKPIVSSGVRSTAAMLNTTTMSHSMPSRTGSRSSMPPGIYPTVPAAPFLLPGAIPYMGYTMDYDLMRLQTPMTTRDMSGLNSSAGLVDSSKYGRDAASNLLNPMYYSGMYMPPVFGLPYNMSFNPYQVPGKLAGATQFSQAGAQTFVPQGVGYEDGDFSKGGYAGGHGSVKGVNSGAQHRGLVSSSIAGGDSYKAQNYDGQKGGYSHANSAAFAMPPGNQGLLSNPYLSGNFAATTMSHQYQPVHGGAINAHAQMMALDPAAHGAGGGHSGRTQHQHQQSKQSGKYGSYEGGNWQP